MSYLTYRTVNLLGALGCAGALIIAVVYFQQHLGLEPCYLCITQRVFVALAGVIFLIAALHNPLGARTENLLRPWYYRVHGWWFFLQSNNCGCKIFLKTLYRLAALQWTICLMFFQRQRSSPCSFAVMAIAQKYNGSYWV